MFKWFFFCIFIEVWYKWRRRMKGNSMTGQLIVIDGVDGSGKGTQIELIKGSFAEGDAVFTREPGGTPKAEEIRKTLLDKTRTGRTVEGDFELLWEARADHIEKVIQPALVRDQLVICDRFDSSTFAYQISCAAQA